MFPFNADDVVPIVATRPLLLLLLLLLILDAIVDVVDVVGARLVTFDVSSAKVEGWGVDAAIDRGMDDVVVVVAEDEGLDDARGR